jgi:hypothetical protein
MIGYSSGSLPPRLRREAGSMRTFHRSMSVFAYLLIAMTLAAGEAELVRRPELLHAAMAGRDDRQFLLAESLGLKRTDTPDQPASEAG